jgi:hypothetical protein
MANLSKNLQRYTAGYESLKAIAPHELPEFVAPHALEDPGIPRSEIALALKNINDRVSKLSAAVAEPPSKRKQVGRKGGSKLKSRQRKLPI